jgi:5-methylcytosine-specific restriction protein B
LNHHIRFSTWGAAVDRENEVQTRDQFQQYMIESGKQPKTASEYARFIEDLSKHSGEDIYTISDVGTIDALVKRYSAGGANYAEGNEYHGGPRAAIKQYLAFRINTQISATPSSANMSSSTPMTDTTDTIPPLNQILYGPPGTGKTHNTIEEALAILDPEYLEIHRADRDKLRGRFAELEASKHVRFVTFHQSFSYEDFVEGLRAEPDEVTGQLRFAPRPGVFKEICDDAVTKVVIDRAVDLDLSGKTIWKMSLGNRSDENHVYQQCILEDRILLGWGSGIDFSGVKSKADIIAKFHLGGAGYATSDYPVSAVNAFVLGMKVGDIVVASDGNSKFRAIGLIAGNYEHVPREEEDDEFSQSRSVQWLKVFDPSTACSAIMNKNFMMKAIYRLGPDVIHLDKLRHLLASNAIDAEVQQGPHARVLIIDEINRGNISRIFGELITLVEASKRAGNREALSVMLPYSREPFSIPNNLYLLGTMNTSDRSLSSLDIALRRRFVFKEMPPRPELLANVVVQGVAIDKLLEVMNQRIEALLDREHCLGHAYFLPLKADPSIERLARIFEQQILPLLKEYFFEDWNRIRWVLNDHRKNDLNCFVLPSDSSVATLFGDEFDGRVQEHMWAINDEAFERVEAYLGILDHAAAATQLSPVASDGSVEYGGFRLQRLIDTTVKVYDKDGERKAWPILKQLATQLGVSHFNTNGGSHNTRQLGAQVIKAAKAAAT